MTEQEKREKVIKGLECCIQHDPDDKPRCRECPYEGACLNRLKNDALALLKRSFTPEEVYRTVIEHGQHDRRFRLGDAINYSFPEVVDILRIELMCKAGDM